MLAEIANGVYSLAVGAKELPFSVCGKEKRKFAISIVPFAAQKRTFIFAYVLRF
jgi:hypothetical protein